MYSPPFMPMGGEASQRQVVCKNLWCNRANQDPDMSPHYPSRFWICKIVIVIMDLAIFRGAVSMGEEFCSQVSCS